MSEPEICHPSSQGTIGPVSWFPAAKRLKKTLRNCHHTPAATGIRSSNFYFTWGWVGGSRFCGTNAFTVWGGLFIERKKPQLKYIIRYKH